MADADPPIPPSDSEERIAWLRDRGVLIEFPNEENKTTKKTSNSKTRKIFIVKIPCDEKKPYQEIEIPISEDAKGDQLLEILLIYFNSISLNTSVIDGLQKTQPTLFGSDSVTVKESTLQALGQKGSVEAFCLSRPCVANTFSGVSFYLDEIGQLKKLDVNSRAVSLATICGFDNVPLVGDMFIARITAPPGQGLKHTDFRLTDIDSGAAWMKAVKKDNYEFGVTTGRVAMEGGGEKELPKGENTAKGYKWSESNDAVEVVLRLPIGTISKDLAITFRTRSLAVKLKATGVVLLFVESLLGSVDPDDCTWTFANNSKNSEEGPDVELTMVKSNLGETWGALELP